MQVNTSIYPTETKLYIWHIYMYGYIHKTCADHFPISNSKNMFTSR